MLYIYRYSSVVSHCEVIIIVTDNHSYNPPRACYAISLFSVNASEMRCLSMIEMPV